MSWEFQDASCEQKGSQLVFAAGFATGAEVRAAVAKAEARTGQAAFGRLREMIAETALGEKYHPQL